MLGLFNVFKKKPLEPKIKGYDPVIRQVDDPDRVVIPLDYQGRVRYLPTVKIGDSVKRGQVIARSRVGNSVCATISGTVNDITTVWSAQSFHSPAIVIVKKSGHASDTEEKWNEPIGADDPQAAMDRLRLAGVVPPWSLSGREFDDSDKEIPDLPPVETFIVTGGRSESTMLTSQILLEQNVEKVADGITRIKAIFPEARFCITAPEQLRRHAEPIFNNLAELFFLPGR